MNIKSNEFKFIGGVILAAILLFSWQITNITIIAILYIVCTILMCYDIYKTIVKNKYRFRWLIAINELTFLILGFIGLYLYTNPVNLSNNIEIVKRVSVENKIEIIFVFCIILNSVLKMKRFER